MSLSHRKSQRRTFLRATYEYEKMKLIAIRRRESRKEYMIVLLPPLGDCCQWRMMLSRGYQRSFVKCARCDASTLLSINNKRTLIALVNWIMASSYRVFFIESGVNSRIVLFFFPERSVSSLRGFILSPPRSSARINQLMFFLGFFSPFNAKALGSIIREDYWRHSCTTHLNRDESMFSIPFDPFSFCVRVDKLYINLKLVRSYMRNIKFCHNAFLEV